jgi:hypothetical protein
MRFAQYLCLLGGLVFCAIPQSLAADKASANPEADDNRKASKGKTTLDLLVFGPADIVARLSYNDLIGHSGGMVARVDLIKGFIAKDYARLANINSSSPQDPMGAIAVVMERPINPAETPNETVASRFPEGWVSVPVVEHRKSPLRRAAMSQISTDEFIASMTALGRLRPPPRPMQRADAVLNDAQIASMKNRLDLTEEQEPYWQAVEVSLREVVWDRRHGVRQRLNSNSLERLKEAAAPLVAMLSAQQRSKIEPLASIVGLRLSRQGR